MTLCLGIRTKSEAFLVADSAVTYNSGGHLKRLKSTVGEIQISGAKTIEESAQKVWEITNNVAITFAGNVNLGNSLAEVIVACVKRKNPIKQSIEKAFLACGPIEKDNPLHQVEFLVLDASNGKLDLFYSNTRTQIIHLIPQGSSVLFGSVPDDVRKQINECAYKVKILKVTGNDALATWITILLSITSHRPMMENGVGGMFSGAWANRDGLKHHPDMLFLQYFSKLDSAQTMETSYCVNRDRLSLFSGSARGGNIGPPFPSWQKKWKEKLTNFHDDAIFDYVSILDLSARRFAVINMAGNRVGSDLMFEIKGKKVIIHFSERLREYLYSEHSGGHDCIFIDPPKKEL